MRWLGWMLLLGAAAGCGIKAPPRPPESTQPAVEPAPLPSAAPEGVSLDRPTPSPNVPSATELEGAEDTVREGDVPDAGAR